MAELVLSVKKLNKYYKKFHAIKDVSFEVHKGEIVGFIGPNGSGKSTTMKCINSLLIPTSGSITVCGKDIVKEREEALKYQASLIEGPGLYHDLTGNENLKLFANLRNVSHDKISKVAKIIDIGTFINKPVSQYSLGMKQRLAIGIVLLSDPKFIILDEPSNGLDPQGVMELRNIILNLAKKGVAVLFSSHQLGEIERIADRIISIKEGEIIPFDNPVADHNNYSITLEGDMEKLSKLVDDIEGLLSFEIINNNLNFVTNTATSLNTVFNLLTSNNFKILEVENKIITIEDLYLEMFGSK